MSTNRDKVHDERQTRAKMYDPGVYLSGNNWLDHAEACARVDQMLLGGASLEQLESSGRKRSAVMSHLGHLKSEHGLAIGREGGIYRFAYGLAVAFGRDIAQMGPALVCNFFKELGLLHYVKVDVHVGNFMGELTLERKLSPKDEFILSWLLAREAGIEPFFLDKILYVGGKYCGPRLGALCRSLRVDYEGEVNGLVGQIAALR